MLIQVKVEQIRPGKSGLPILDTEFSKTEISVGRSSANDVVLKEPDVSGRHALLSVESDQEGEVPALYIVDLESANGTYVENSRISPGEPCLLEDQRRIIIGNFLITAEVNTDNLESVEQIEVEDEEQAEVAEENFAQDSIVENEDSALEEDSAVEEADLDESEEPTREADSLSLERLDELIADPATSQIVLSTTRGLLVECDGLWMKASQELASEEFIDEAVSRLTADVSSAKSPQGSKQNGAMIDLIRADGVRISTVCAPRSLSGTTLRIKKLAGAQHSLEKLVANKVLAPELADVLVSELEAGANIAICGPKGSGTSELLLALTAELAASARTVLIQSYPQVSVPGVVDRLQASGCLNDDLHLAHLLCPERVIIDEFSEDSAADLLNAVLSGAPPVLLSASSKTIDCFLSLLEVGNLKNQQNLPLMTLRKCIAQTLDIIAQMNPVGVERPCIARVCRLASELDDSGEFLLDDEAG